MKPSISLLSFVPLQRANLLVLTLTISALKLAMYIMVKTENIISDFFVKFSLAFLIQNDIWKIIDDLEKLLLLLFSFLWIIRFVVYLKVKILFLKKMKKIEKNMVYIQNINFSPQIGSQGKTITVRQLIW